MVKPGFPGQRMFYYFYGKEGGCVKAPGCCH